MMFGEFHSIVLFFPKEQAKLAELQGKDPAAFPALPVSSFQQKCPL